MVTPIVGVGTAEAQWLAWAAASTWPQLDLTGSAGAGAPVVVAPHPDDEILGVGGLLAMLGAADVIAVTDGEASHPESTVHSRAALAALRRAETADAVAALGLDPSRVFRLGQPDGHIDEAALTAVLRARLRPGRWCFATWRGDGHPDHEAVGRAAAAACRQTGAVLLEYPVWMWHWAGPGDDRVPWERVRRVDLARSVQERKALAVAAFPSQIRPLGPEPGDAAILPPWILARFARPFEVVFAAALPG